MKKSSKIIEPYTHQSTQSISFQTSSDDNSSDENDWSENAYRPTGGGLFVYPTEFSKEVAHDTRLSYGANDQMHKSDRINSTNSISEIM